MSFSAIGNDEISQVLVARGTSFVKLLSPTKGSGSLPMNNIVFRFLSQYRLLRVQRFHIKVQCYLVTIKPLDPQTTTVTYEVQEVSHVPGLRTDPASTRPPPLSPPLTPHLKHYYLKVPPTSHHGSYMTYDILFYISGM